MKRAPLKRKTPLRSKSKLKAGKGLAAKKPMKKSSPVKMSKIRESAKGEQCLVRVPGVCNGNPETTVLAHLNGGGAAMKASDIHGAYCCASCHTWLDGGYAKDSSREIRDLYHLQGIIRTQVKLIEKGLITIG